MLRQQELLKNPEYRAAQLAQMRMMLPQDNPGLIDELQLTPDEAAELFELLARHQLEMNETSLPIMAAGNADPAVMQDRMREEQLKYRANDVERVLEAARPHLNAAQLDALRTMLESQIVLTRATSQGALTTTGVPGTSSAATN